MICKLVLEQLFYLLFPQTSLFLLALVENCDVPSNLQHLLLSSVSLLSQPHKLRLKFTNCTLILIFDVPEKLVTDESLIMGSSELQFIYRALLFQRC